VKKSLFVFIISALISQFCLNGCTPSIPVKVDRVISSDRLIKRLEANRRKVKSFIGTGSISIKTSEMDAKSSFQVEIKKPDSVKISFFGPFGIDLAFALITPQNFQFYDAINNIYYRGKVKPGVMKEILKINISFDELIDVATGSVNLTDKLRSDPNKFEAVDELYKLTYIDSVNRKSSNYWIKSEELEIRQYQLNDSKGKNLVDAKYSDFMKIEENTIPKQIKMNDLLNNQQIKIEYRIIEVNKEIGKLIIDIPDDAKIIEL
jgi:outer membrane biogenesis lipoprotein LolB